MPSCNEIVDAVEAVFQQRAKGQAATSRGLIILEPGGKAFHARGGANGDFATLKWFGYYPSNKGTGVPDFWPLIFLSETQKGMPVAVMDGRRISGVRTAAITTVAARRLADPGSRTIAFIACGVQARAHFDMLAASFPVERVYTYSKSGKSAQEFAIELRERGYEATTVANPRGAVSQADIVISSIPHRPGNHSFLEVDWLRPGGFISMVDHGWCWKRESMTKLTRVATDDLDQGGGASGFNYDEPIKLDLAILTSSPEIGHERSGRSALLFSGTGLADLAVAGLAYSRARTLGIGTVFDL